jgi:hypothetical protein
LHHTEKYCGLCYSILSKRREGGKKGQRYRGGARGGAERLGKREKLGGT